MKPAWLLLFFGPAVWAGPELPDYRVALDEHLAEGVDQLNQVGRYRDAIKLAGRVQRAMGRLSGVSYEAGYAHYQLGEYDMALAHYDTALKHDPECSSAAYDRGEIRLIKGQHDKAGADFQMVVRLKPHHWAGHFRLAHIAGLLGDSTQFEEHLMDALHVGFDLEVVMSDPDWARFIKHPELRPVLRKVIVLYGNDQLAAWVGERP